VTQAISGGTKVDVCDLAHAVGTFLAAKLTAFASSASSCCVKTSMSMDMRIMMGWGVVWRDDANHCRAMGTHAA